MMNPSYEKERDGFVVSSMRRRFHQKHQHLPLCIFMMMCVLMISTCQSFQVLTTNTKHIRYQSSQNDHHHHSVSSFSIVSSRRRSSLCPPLYATKQSIDEPIQGEEKDPDYDDDDDMTIKKALSGKLHKEKVTKTRTNKDNKKPRSRAQIKKLKFLMNQEVETLIQANDPSAPQKAEGNIKRLQKLYKENSNDNHKHAKDYKPNILNYNVLVRAYAKSGRDDAAQRAEQILNRLLHVYDQTGDEDLKPNVITYTEVIDAYARCSDKDKDSAEKAERILLKIMKDAEDEQERRKVLRQRKLKDRLGSDSVEENGDDDVDDGEIEGLDGSIVMPTSITCDAVIHAWAKRGTKESAERAERILEKMEYLRKTRGYSSSNSKNTIQPTAYSFATVVSAWARAVGTNGGVETAERAQYVLERMNVFRDSLKKEKGKNNEEYIEQLKPDRVLYNSLIDAWSRSGHPMASTKAEALLNEMENLGIVPDTITFNTVINAHANSAHVNAAKAAEKVLMRMEMAAAATSNKTKKTKGISTKEQIAVVPNTRTYNQVLKSYSKSKVSGAAQRADKLLQYMLQSDKKEIKPDVISFSTCLDVWAKSKEPGKAERANAILHKMIDFQQIKPNEVSYNTVLNACAFSAFTEEAEKRKALTIAISLFNEMLQSELVKPDAISYGMVLKCVANLVPQGDTRNKMASDLFEKCCKEGLVNDLVFNEVRRAVAPNVLNRLLQDLIPKRKTQKKKKNPGNMTTRDLPKDFVCNVKEARKHNSGNKQQRERKGSHASNNKRRKKKTEEPKEKVIRPFRNISEISWQSGRDV